MNARTAATRRRRLLATAAVIVTVLIPTWLSVKTIATRKGPARLYFSSPYAQVYPGETFTLQLRVSTGGRVINAVQSKIQLDPKLVAIVGMTTDSSFCSLYTENSSDPTRGTVTIACGTPHPGFEGDSVVVTLTLRAKTAGSDTITVDPLTASVLADDGKGTNILDRAPTYDLSIKQGTY